jgi:DNA-binding MarR family transcriptional regulator
LELHEEIVVALRRIMRAIDLHSRQLMQQSGLTGPQHLVLRAILRRGPLAAGALAKGVSLSPGTVTSILDRLEQRMLVTRTRSEADRRRVEVTLTPLGAQIAQAAPTPLQESFVAALRQLREWEQTQILSSLQRVAEMMDAQDLDAAPVLSSQRIDQ